MALVLQLVVSTQLKWLPVAGPLGPHPQRGCPGGDPDAHGDRRFDPRRQRRRCCSRAFSHMILPALVIAAYPIGLFARLTRAGLLETMGEEHVRMARAIGYTERAIIWRFALRPSLGPVLSALALVFGFALGNTFLVENLFNYQGLGSYAVDSIDALDAPGDRRDHDPRRPRVPRCEPRGRSRPARHGPAPAGARPMTAAGRPGPRGRSARRGRRRPRLRALELRPVPRPPPGPAHRRHDRGDPLRRGDPRAGDRAVPG